MLKLIIVKLFFALCALLTLVSLYEIFDQNHFDFEFLFQVAIFWVCIELAFKLKSIHFVSSPLIHVNPTDGTSPISAHRVSQMPQLPLSKLSCASLVMTGIVHLAMI